MGHQKTLNLLNEASNYKFLTRKWNIVNDQSNANYDEGNEIIYNKEVLKSNLCDYNDAYIIVGDDIITTAHKSASPIASKNCAPFTTCITKIDRKTIDDAEDLHLAMSMYNLIEYSSNYSDTTKSIALLEMKQLILMLILQSIFVLNISSISLNY